MENQNIIVKNTFYELTLDSKTGSIQQFGPPGVPMLAASGSEPLFILSMRDNDGKQELIDATQFDKIRIDRQQRGLDTLIDVIFSQNGSPLIVTVSARCPENEPNTYWRIAVQGISPDKYLEWTDTPGTRIINDLPENNGKGEIFWPGHEGCVIDAMKPRYGVPPFQNDYLTYPFNGVKGYYPGACQMQFMAYYNERGGIYYAAHDPSHGPKGVDFMPTEDMGSFHFFLQVFCGTDRRDAYEQDWDVVMGVFNGDWMTAAERYRDWMETTDSSLPKKLKDNPRCPEWLKEAPVVLMYAVRGDGDDKGELPPNEYFPYENAMPTVTRLSKSFDSKVMSLLMHWESTAPWAPPYVWPPYGGEESLRKYTDMLHQAGHTIGVYCSGVAWTQTSSITDYSQEEKFEREGLAEEMCLGPSGEMKASICNGPRGQGQRLGYEMCIAREWPRQTVLDEIKKIVGSGIDYIQYFDQNMGAAAPLCYNAAHGHPGAPGPWLTRAMQSLVDDAADMIAEINPQATLGCESGAAQPYLRSLMFSDLRFNLQFIYGKAVPAYAFLFHEYVNNFMGNQVCTNYWLDAKKSPDHLLFRTAYSFNAGDTLSVVLKDGGNIHWSWVAKWDIPGPDQEAISTMIRNLNAWRQNAGKEFLLFGRMLKPFPVSCDKYILHYTAGQPREQTTHDSVLSARWQTGERKAQFLTNYLRHEQVVEIDFGKSINVTLTHDAEGKKQEKINGCNKLRLTIAPLSAVMIEEN